MQYFSPVQRIFGKYAVVSLHFIVNFAVAIEKITIGPVA